MRYTHPALIDHLASHYVLGTLQGGARRRFERLQRERADVQLAVQQWQQRLGLLSNAVPAPSPAQAPSVRVWEVIAARTQPAAPARSTGSRWRWLQPASWGLGGFASGLVAAGALLLVAPSIFITTDQIAMRSDQRLPQSYVGLLTDDQGNGKVLVSSLRYGTTMTIKLIGAVQPPESGVHVLWAVPADAPAFVLGTLPAKGSATSQMSDTSEKILSKVTKLKVTLEANAQVSAPSAAVVLQGNCAKLW